MPKTEMSRRRENTPIRGTMLLYMSPSKEEMQGRWQKDKGKSTQSLFRTAVLLKASSIQRGAMVVGVHQNALLSWTMCIV